MKVVLDTNIFIAALISPGGSNDQLIQHWLDHRFTLITSEYQLSELRRVANRKRYQGLIYKAQVGKLINYLKESAVLVAATPVPDISPDPDDNHILAIALRSEADYLVSLDLADVVGLQRIGKTRILHSKAFSRELR